MSVRQDESIINGGSSSEADQPCLTAAIEYLARGWCPIPLCRQRPDGICQHHGPDCGRPGKRPLIRWKRFQLDDRPTEGLVRSWWRRWPDANVGLVMGPNGGLIGLDIDSDQGRQILLDWLHPKPIPITPSFDTPNGGRRVLLDWPDGLDLRISSRRDRQNKEDLRILALRSITVAPPSRLVVKGPEGLPLDYREYAWNAGLGPETPLAPVPPEVIAQAQAHADLRRRPGGRADGHNHHARRDAGADPPRMAYRAERYALKCATSTPAVEGRNGHGQTYKVACKLVGKFDLPAEAAFHILRDTYNPRCEPPWVEDDLWHKVNSAMETHREIPEVEGPPPTSPEANGRCPSPTADGPVHLTDRGNAARLARDHGKDLRHCHPWHKWLVWDGCRWRPDDSGEPTRRAKQTVARLFAWSVAELAKVQVQIGGAA